MKLMSQPNLCCCCLVTQSCPIPMTPWTAAHQASVSFTISCSLLKFMSIELVRPSNLLILCLPLLLLLSIFPSIRVFSNESAVHIKWSKYWSFNFSISPSSEYSGLISFRINWFDLFTVQGTLKTLFQHHNLKKQNEKIESQLANPWCDRKTPGLWGAMRWELEPLVNCTEMYTTADLVSLCEKWRE